MDRQMVDGLLNFLIGRGRYIRYLVHILINVWMVDLNNTGVFLSKEKLENDGIIIEN